MTFFPLSNFSREPVPALGRSVRMLAASLLLMLAVGSSFVAANAEELPAVPFTVNVNTADARTLANVLQGVGLSRAAAIVNYREQHGSFSDLQQLRNVKGVGARTLELNATRILFSE